MGMEEYVRIDAGLMSTPADMYVCVHLDTLDHNQCHNRRLCASQYVIEYARTRAFMHA